MKIDAANDGPCPPAEILRAIRHSVAAVACGRAWTMTGDTRWARDEAQHRLASKREVHQAAALSEAPASSL